MCSPVETLCSPLDSLVEMGTTVEIAFDNAKSHADFACIVYAAEARVLTKRRKRTQLRFNYKEERIAEEDDHEMALDDLRTFEPTGDYMHNSFPGRNNTLGHKDILCRWASSSDSDFAYVPSRRSFDRMLKEASSGTTSARANVPRPVRRTSLKVSPYSLENDEKVLNKLCSNLLGSIEINTKW
mmetsp:Transcript_12689/g.24116  ORF Transcript_12689/g.24116 Transcript_12689/m.24116 type:complete len:184 (-) Transcript_12689:116-667(-)|eukprot:scaffold4587_cov182-Amphora_coffeaeformis.AAC.18